MQRGMSHLERQAERGGETEQVRLMRSREVMRIIDGHRGSRGQGVVRGLGEVRIGGCERSSLERDTVTLPEQS